MSNTKLILLAGVALASLSGVAAAQTAPQTTLPATPPTPVQTPPAPAPAEPGDDDETQADGETAAAVGDVVVTGRANDIRTSVDSISFSVADDLQSPTGALADALRNIPSVEVDPEGNVTLRGDPGVTILVDGRPSSLFQGESRGQVILTQSAAQYSRIEIMTNPSAAYSPEGSGGVINLITKPVPAGQSGAAATTTGSIRAAIGDNGRFNLGLNAARTRGPLTLTLDGGLRRDSFEQEVDRLRERFDVAADRFLAARQTQDVEGAADHGYLRTTADYRLDDKTQVVGELRLTDIETDNRTLETYEAEDAAGGIASAYRRRSSGGYSAQFVGATGRVVRRFDDEGHDWTTELRLDRVRGGVGTEAVTDQRLPAAADVYEAIDMVNNVDQLGLTSAYVRPLANGGKLRAGYELRGVSLEIDNRVARGGSPATLVPDPLVSNDYHVDEAIHALYATWEQPFDDKFSAQFGLRLEQWNRDLDQATLGAQTSYSDFSAYPTLHVSYALTDAQTLRGSYSKRVQRPRPSELNPFPMYVDPLNYTSGNPDLEAQETDAFEAMWQMRSGPTFYQATVYYRDTSKAFTPVSTDIGGGVFLTRPENLGARTETGLELVANGRLHSTLRYNASVNLFRQEIDASTIPGGVDRSGDVVSGRLNLNWQPTDADFVQVSTVWTGEQLLAQGTRDPSTLVNLGYRRKLTETLALNLTVRDLFDDFGDVTVLDTPEFRDRTERWFGGRTGFIGLTWNFGGQRNRPADPTFDFSGPPTGG